MKTLMTFLMTCAVFGMMSASAMAGGDGGGGAKDDGTIVVKNDEDAHVLLVVVGEVDDTNLSTLLAAGAQIVPPGGTASFDVAAGTQLVSAVLVEDASPYATLNIDTESVAVPKNATVNVSATADADDTVLTVVP